MRAHALALLLPLALTGVGFAQTRNPFAPPQARIQYAPDRTCDLLHVAVDLDIDYPNRLYRGTSTSTMSPLRNGITTVMIHAGTTLEILSVKVDGVDAKYRHEGKQLFIDTKPLVKGKPIKIEVKYQAKNSRGGGFGSGGGFHWMSPTATNPTRVGFWTQGETDYNSEWAPTWDYPNDLATSETHTTVQSDWDVIGNGVLASTSLSADKKRKTYVWKMTQPHATYLLAVCGGPFDIKKDKWEGVDLWYVVPRGQGYLIDDSFGDTKDMLSFYSKVLGVKYAWPKYAQCAMYDFGGGMENVSVTILGEGSLTEARDGFRRMASLNAHELGHQWFGDLVTCMHWGDAWLNESFATFMESIYMEHSRGKTGYDWEVENNMQSYFAEARRYKRPISTHLFPNFDAMFDSHTYPKGSSVMHTLRRQLGDEAFFAGLNYYLTKWRHTPVESAQLRRAMTEATGINCEPFWAQWIDKPGHPVLDYTWTYDVGKVKLTVKQTQDTSAGTPIYDIPAKVWLATGASRNTHSIHLTKAEETFEIPSTTKPSAVLLDPNHDFLREIPTLHWDSSELETILQYAPFAADRQEAMNRLLSGSPSDATVRLVVAQLKADTSLEQPVFRQVSALANLNREDLREFWMSQLDHKNMDRQAQAAQALARLPKNAATVAKFRSLINDRAPIQVVVTAINALATWDKAGNADVFRKAQNIRDRRSRIKRAADDALKTS
jgi:aminopeptidase N